MPIQIEDITPSASEAIDYKLVRRGAGTFTMELVPDTLSVAWGEITGTLSDQADLQAALDDKSPTNHTHVIADVTGLQAALDGKADTVHSHVIGDVTGLQTALDGKADISHTHDISDISGAMAGFNAALTDGVFMFVGDPPTAHTHDLVDVTDVTISAVNLNALDDGVDTTLHFHAADRARANHTGTQASSTVTSGSGHAVMTRASASGGALTETTLALSTLLGRGDSGSVDEITLGTGLAMTGTVLSATGGGGGTPAGSDTQLQFNNAGAFGASADLTFDDTTNTLALPGVDTGLNIQEVTNVPSAPASGLLRLFATERAGKSFPAWVDDQAGVTLAQSSLSGGRQQYIWTPSGVTAGASLGDSTASGGTFQASGPNFAAPGFLSWAYRGTYRNVATTLNQSLGINSTNLLFCRDPSTSEFGGLYFFARWAFDTWTNGGRVAAGGFSTGAPVTADPSTFINSMGFIVDAADNGAISFLTSDGSSFTKAPTGLTIVANKGYDVWFHAPMNGTEVYWMIRDSEAGTVASGTATATLPASNSRQAAVCRASNAALTAATAVRISVASVYAEADM